MKKILSVFIICLGTITIVNAIPAGSYWKTCHRCSVNTHGTLSCRCYDVNQYPVWTRLRNARQCNRVKNHNGNLQCIQWNRPQHHRRPSYRPLPTGSYLQTCRRCTLQSSILRCACQKRNGRYRNTNLNHPGLCRNIKNNNGQLICKGKLPKPDNRHSAKQIRKDVRQGTWSPSQMLRG